MIRRVKIDNLTLGVANVEPPIGYFFRVKHDLH